MKWLKETVLSWIEGQNMEVGLCSVWGVWW